MFTRTLGEFCYYNLALTWSQNECKTILFEELMLGMEKNKSIYLYLLHDCFDFGNYEQRIQTSFCFTL